MLVFHHLKLMTYPCIHSIKNDATPAPINADCSIKYTDWYIQLLLHQLILSAVSRPSFMAPQIRCIFTSEAAALLKINLRNLVPMCRWFPQIELAMMPYNPTGIYWQDNRKRGEMSCISSKHYEQNTVLTFGKSGHGKDTCSAAYISAGGLHGNRGKGGGSRSHCGHWLLRPWGCCCAHGESRKSIFLHGYCLLLLLLLLLYVCIVPRLA